MAIHNCIYGSIIEYVAISIELFQGIQLSIYNWVIVPPTASSLTLPTHCSTMVTCPLVIYHCNSQLHKSRICLHHQLVADYRNRRIKRKSLALQEYSRLTRLSMHASHQTSSELYSLPQRHPSHLHQVS